jgi:hypothetical protein
VIETSGEWYEGRGTTVIGPVADVLPGSGITMLADFGASSLPVNINSARPLSSPVLPLPAP